MIGEEVSLRLRLLLSSLTFVVLSVDFNVGTSELFKSKERTTCLDVGPHDPRPRCLVFPKLLV